MAEVKGLNTPYEDCAVKYPDAKSGEGTGFGSPVVEGGMPPTEGGEWGSGVQYAEVAGSDLGKGFTKIPGSGGQNN